MWPNKKLLRKRKIIIGSSVLLVILFFVTISLFGKQPSNNNDKNYSAWSGISSQGFSTKQQYTTVFFDDFDKLDKDVWTFHTQTPSSVGSYNARFKTNEDNVYVDQGCLVLDCAKTAVKGDGNYRKSDGEIAPVEYIAPYISTCDYFAMTAGKISARIKVSKGVVDGMFPLTFFTFGQNAGWAYAHEMDIMEGISYISSEDRHAKDGTLIPAGSHLSFYRTALLYGTSNKRDGEQIYYIDIHWALYNKGIYYKGIDYNTIDVTEWHIYSVEWNKDNVVFFIDDNLVASYDAETLGAIDADGNIGFYYPQDIRFNIKAKEFTTDKHGYLFVDWVKAEALNNTPCLSISHEDVIIKVGDHMCINPTFNTGCTNRAFTVEIENDQVLAYSKYNNSRTQQVPHNITGMNPGSTTVTLRAANGSVENTFKVMVK